MLASVGTFAIDGVDGREVIVEVDIRRGLPSFAIVGLPDRAVQEARERVQAGLLNAGLEFPKQRVTANLAPASVRKAGPSFDLALAVATLAASGQVPADGLDSYAVCGELSLSGALRPVHGAVAMALGAREAGYTRLIVAPESAPEAALIEGIEVLGAPTLTRLVDLMHGRWSPQPPPPPPRGGEWHSAPDLDLADVRGQHDARRALEIAAAGGHNLLMVGPPGAGKTMLARRLPGILPPPSFDEALEITRVHSVAGTGDGRLATTRPFRAPHHSTSASGLVGGGTRPRPGEITLAHRGVLFLDELAEFSRRALEALRQPLEDGRVEVVRGQRAVTFPAAVMLVGACNTCPCARRAGDCRCTDVDRARYGRRLSGPLLDRIDLVCTLEPAAPLELLSGSGEGREGSVAVRRRVVAARELQRARLEGSGVACNADMDARLTRRHARLDTGTRSTLLAGHRASPLSARGHERVLKIARTIADLAGSGALRREHVEEALGFRLAAGMGMAA